MDDNDTPLDREWERGWDGDERAQRRRLAKLSLADKLRWLEEAQHTVERLRDGRDRIRHSGAGFLRDAEGDVRKDS